MNKPSHQTNRCPLCQSEVRVEPSVLFGDTQCPGCDKKLWYLAAANDARFFDFEASAQLQQRTYEFVSERFEVDADELRANPKILDERDVDSLEALEMLMDLEEELGLV